MVTVCQKKDRICMQEKDLPRMGWTLPIAKAMGARFYKKNLEVRFPSSVFWEEIGRAGIRSSVVSRRPDGIEWILYPPPACPPVATPDPIVIPILPVVVSPDPDAHPEGGGAQEDRKLGDTIVAEKLSPRTHEIREVSTQTSNRSFIPWGATPSAFQYRKDRPEALATLAEQLWAGLNR